MKTASGRSLARWRSVRAVKVAGKNTDAVRDGLVAMLSQGLSPEQALARAQRGADRAIRDYNTRLGT